MVVTQTDALFWATACSDFKDVGKPDADSLEEVKANYPGFTQDSACNWAVYGLVVQDELTLELYFGELAKYIQDLRAQNLFLREMVDARQEMMDKQLKKIQGVSDSTSQNETIKMNYENAEQE